MKYKPLFGPVPSQRPGIFLGVDLVLNKVYSLNCIYEKILGINLLLPTLDAVSKKNLKKLIRPNAKLDIDETNKYLSELLHDGYLISQQQERGTFFHAK